MRTRAVQRVRNIREVDKVVYNQQVEDARVHRCLQHPTRKLQLVQLQQQRVHLYLEQDDATIRLDDAHGTGERDEYYVEDHEDCDCEYCDDC